MLFFSLLAGGILFELWSNLFGRLIKSRVRADLAQERTIRWSGSRGDPWAWILLLR